MNIATALNEYYLPYTYTMLLSLLENNTDERFDIFLLIDTLSETARDTLKDLAAKYGSEVHFLRPDVNRIRTALENKTNWGVETSFRLTLCDLLPADLDRILYIDGDVIVIGKINELYNMDFSGSDLVAGYDLFSCGDHKPDSLAIHDPSFQTIISQDAYFNAGIVLYDINKLREKNMASRYFDIIDTMSCTLPYPDQDILNYAHYKHVRFFDTMKYNFQGMLAVTYDGGYNADRIRNEVCILHYIDKKPWSGGDHIHYDAENIWWDYALQTPFAENLMKAYIRASMDEYIQNSVRELKNDNDTLRKELQRVSISVKNLLKKLNP